MDKIAVLIPCYNEAKTVEKVVTDFKRVLPDATVYVYDNNSTDGTAALAAAAGAVVRHEYQQGKGNVIRRMFREIDAEAYIMVDGDDTYPAESAPEMVKAVTEHQADMVVGIGFPPPITPRTNARSTILATTWCGFLPTTSSAARSRIS